MATKINAEEMKNYENEVKEIMMGKIKQDVEYPIYNLKQYTFRYFTENKDELKKLGIDIEINFNEIDNYKNVILFPNINLFEESMANYAFNEINKYPKFYIQLFNYEKNIFNEDFNLNIEKEIISETKFNPIIYLNDEKNKKPIGCFGPTYFSDIIDTSYDGSHDFIKFLYETNNNFIKDIIFVFNLLNYGLNGNSQKDLVSILKKCEDYRVYENDHQFMKFLKIVYSEYEHNNFYFIDEYSKK